MDRRYIGDREIAFRRGHSDTGIITFYAEFDESQLQTFFDAFPDHTVYAMRIDDWNSELSPWSVPAVFGKEDFGNGAERTLNFILNEMIPEMSCDRYIIGGYSLAGLFSLWACYRSDVFCGCAASSPSVWFDGWIDFIQNNQFKAEKAYLSLGDREHITKNQRMKKVRDNILIQNEVLSKDIDCTLEWNAGGHFDGVPERKTRSFRALL